MNHDKILPSKPNLHLEQRQLWPETWDSLWRFPVTLWRSWLASPWRHWGKTEGRRVRHSFVTSLFEVGNHSSAKTWQVFGTDLQTGTMQFFNFSIFCIKSNSNFFVTSSREIRFLFYIICILSIFAFYSRKKSVYFRIKDVNFWCAAICIDSIWKTKKIQIKKDKILGGKFLTTKW